MSGTVLQSVQVLVVVGLSAALLFVAAHAIRAHWEREARRRSRRNSHRRQYMPGGLIR